MTAPNDDDFALALDDYRTLYGDETRENLAKAASQRVLKAIEEMLAKSRNATHLELIQGQLCTDECGVELLRLHAWPLTTAVCKHLLFNDIQPPSMVTAVAVERFLAILARHGRPKEMYMALVEQLCADHVPGLIESSDLERVLQSPSIFLVHALQHVIRTTGTSAKSLDANLTPILQDLTLATRHAQLFECSLSIDRIIAFMTDLVAPHFAEFSGLLRINCHSEKSFDRVYFHSNALFMRIFESAPAVAISEKWLADCVQHARQCSVNMSLLLLHTQLGDTLDSSDIPSQPTLSTIGVAVYTALFLDQFGLPKVYDCDWLFDRLIANCSQLLSRHGTPFVKLARLMMHHATTLLPERHISMESMDCNSSYYSVFPVYLSSLALDPDAKSRYAGYRIIRDFMRCFDILAQLSWIDRVLDPSCPFLNIKTMLVGELKDVILGFLKDTTLHDGGAVIVLDLLEKVCSMTVATVDELGAKSYMRQSVTLLYFVLKADRFNVLGLRCGRAALLLRKMQETNSMSNDDNLAYWVEEINAMSHDM